LCSSPPLHSVIMPAAKQNKRAAAQVAVEKAPKKVRQDPLLVGTLEAIRQAQDLPEPCRAMLLAAASGCLNTPKDERHEAQTRAVQWIEEAIASVHAKLQEAANSADAAVTEALGQQSGLEAKVTEAAATLNAREEVSKTKEGELAEAAKAILDDDALVVAALAAQAKGDASFEAAKKEKETLDAALEESAKPLKAGACEAEEAEAHIARLLPLALKAGLDESLTMALPKAGTKALAERGTFDVMVLEGLEKGLEAKVVELAKLIGEGAPAAAERAEAVEKAQSSLAMSQERKHVAAEVLLSAQASQEEAVVALAGAKGAVAALEPERKTLEKLREERRLELEHFQTYNLECFRMLKEKETLAQAAAKKDVSMAPAETADTATAGA